MPIRQGSTTAYNREVMMPVLRRVCAFILAVTLLGCSKHEGATLKVEVSPGLSASATDAVLNLSIYELLDSSPTNYRSATYESQSLQSPFCSNSSIEGTNKCSQERRLVAIIPEGFKILFIRNDNGIMQGNTILFRFNQTTQTNTMGWRIVGMFK